MTQSLTYLYSLSPDCSTSPGHLVPLLHLASHQGTHQHPALLHLPLRGPIALGGPAEQGPMRADRLGLRAGIYGSSLSPYYIVLPHKDRAIYYDSVSLWSSFQRSVVIRVGFKGWLVRRGEARERCARGKMGRRKKGRLSFLSSFFPSSPSLRCRPSLLSTRPYEIKRDDWGRISFKVLFALTKG